MSSLRALKAMLRDEAGAALPPASLIPRSSEPTRAWLELESAFELPFLGLVDAGRDALRIAVSAGRDLLQAALVTRVRRDPDRRVVVHFRRVPSAAIGRALPAARRLLADALAGRRAPPALAHFVALDDPGAEVRFVHERDQTLGGRLVRDDGELALHLDPRDHPRPAPGLTVARGGFRGAVAASFRSGRATPLVLTTPLDRPARPGRLLVHGPAAQALAGQEGAAVWLQGATWHDGSQAWIEPSLAGARLCYAPSASSSLRSTIRSCASDSSVVRSASGETLPGSLSLAVA